MTIYVEGMDELVQVLLYIHKALEIGDNVLKVMMYMYAHVMKWYQSLFEDMKAWRMMTSESFYSSKRFTTGLQWKQQLPVPTLSFYTYIYSIT